MCGAVAQVDTGDASGTVRYIDARTRYLIATNCYICMQFAVEQVYDGGIASWQGRCGSSMVGASSATCSAPDVRVLQSGGSQTFLVRSDEDVSHIFASLTESELERELHYAERCGLGI